MLLWNVLDKRETRAGAMTARVLLMTGLAGCVAVSGTKVVLSRPPVHSTWAAPRTGCHSAHAVGGSPKPGTARMAARLTTLIAQMDAARTPALASEYAASLQIKLRTETNKYQRFGLMMQSAETLLCAGQNEAALTAFDGAAALAKKEIPGYYYTHLKYMLPREKAMAYMRMGELQNCCASNNADSCLLPIRGKGIHTAQFGSQHSIALLTQMLAADPRNAGARWSLNIGYMTLGQYPWNVPPRWLIPPAAFQSEYALPRFPNVAPTLALDGNGLGGGCVIDDFDGDGWLDIMVSRGGPREQMRFFHNNGDGTFTDRTKGAGLTGETGGINLLQADFDNDGLPDVLVLRGNGLPPSLLRNEGNGTFEDITEQAGLLGSKPSDKPDYPHSQTAVWFDFNGDGYLDLFIGSRTILGDARPQPCQLFRNNGDGTFTECAKECGLALMGNVTATVSADFNGDARPDLYIARYGESGLLFRNDGAKSWWGQRGGAWKFTDVSATAHVPGPTLATTCAFFDYDNDGWPDLLVAGGQFNGITEVARDYLHQGAGQTPHLYRNQHDGTFRDITMEARLNRTLMAQALNVGDLDNDGWLDVYVGTGGVSLGDLVPKRMFRNDGKGRFQDVTTAGDFGHLQKGTAISWGDLSNTGQQDILEVMGGTCEGDVAHNALYKNPGNGNAWIALTLEGVRSNRSAVGARLKVDVQTANGPRVLWRTVGSGGSYGANPLRQEIGLGRAQSVRRVTVFWPTTGQTQHFTNLALNRRYKIREDADGAVLCPGTKPRSAEAATLAANRQ